MKFKLFITALIAVFCLAISPTTSFAQAQLTAPKKGKETTTTVNPAPAPAADIKTAPLFDASPVPAVTVEEEISLTDFLTKSSTVAYTLYPAISFLFVMFWKRKDPQEKIQNIIKATTIVLGIGLTLIVSGLPALNVMLIGSILIWVVALYKGLGKQAAK